MAQSKVGIPSISSLLENQKKEKEKDSRDYAKTLINIPSHPKVYVTLAQRLNVQ
jgi:hypothetical protein